MKTYSNYRKHKQIKTNKYSVWYKGEYRGVVRGAYSESDALSLISTEKYPDRKDIKLVRIIIEE